MTVPADALTVELAFGSDPLDPANHTWTDVTAYVRGGTTNRGRASFIEPYATGTASVELENADRRFDPLNTTGPYASGGATQVVPGTPLRITATVTLPVSPFTVSDVVLFAGFLDDPIGYESGFPETSTVTFTASDAFRPLAVAELARTVDPTGAGDETDDRMNNVLDEIGWPTGSGAFRRSIDTAARTPLAGTIGGGNALAALQNVALADGGSLYADRNGGITYVARLSASRYDPTGTTVTFSDDGTKHTSSDWAVPFSDPEISHNAILYNRVGMTLETSAAFTAEDATSIDAYFLRSLDVSGAPLANGAHAESRVDYLLQALKDPVSAVSAVTVTVLDPTDATAYTGATLEFESPGWVRFTPAGTGSPAQLEHKVLVDSIAHTWTATQWSWRVGLTPFARVAHNDPTKWLILDDATRGKLDTATNVLAY